MHACTYTSLLEIHKGNHYDCVYTIFLLMQDENDPDSALRESKLHFDVEVCCVHGQTEAAYFISCQVIAFVQLWTAIHPFYCTCSFLKYTFNMCLNFKLFVLEELNPPVLNLSKNWCTPTIQRCQLNTLSWSHQYLAFEEHHSMVLF